MHQFLLLPGDLHHNSRIGLRYLERSFEISGLSCILAFAVLEVAIPARPDLDEFAKLIKVNERDSRRTKPPDPQTTLQD